MEQYWNDLQVNYERINIEVSKSDHPYFTDREYEKQQTSTVYESIKALINQQYQLRFMKTGSFSTGEQTTVQDRFPVTPSM